MGGWGWSPYKKNFRLRFSSIYGKLNKLNSHGITNHNLFLVYAHNKIIILKSKMARSIQFLKQSWKHSAQLYLLYHYCYSVCCRGIIHKCNQFSPEYHRNLKSLWMLTVWSSITEAYMKTTGRHFRVLLRRNTIWTIPAPGPVMMLLPLINCFN